MVWRSHDTDSRDQLLSREVRHGESGAGSIRRLSPSMAEAGNDYVAWGFMVERKNLFSEGNS